MFISDILSSLIQPQQALIEYVETPSRSDTVLISGDLKKHKAYIKAGKKLIRNRVHNLPKAYRLKTALTLRDVEKVEILKHNAIYKSDNIIISSVVELNTLTPDEMPSQVLSDCIEIDLLNGRDKKTYIPEDHLIAVTFANIVINQSNLSNDTKEIVMNEIKAEYPNYDFLAGLRYPDYNMLEVITDASLEERIKHYYNLTLFLQNNLSTLLEKFPDNDEIAYRIAGNNIPLKYILNTVPDDEIEMVLKQLNISTLGKYKNLNIKAEFQTLERMRECAAIDPIPKKTGHLYYNQEHPGTKGKQLVKFVIDHKKRPSQADPKHDGFVNQGFIDACRQLENTAVDETYISLTDKDLYRLPNRLFTLSQLKGLNISYNHLSYLPREIKNLKQLEFLNSYDNHLHSLPFLSKTLETLFLGNNHFTSFSITRLGKVKNLYLENNEITSFCGNPKTSALETLNLSGNQLKAFPSHIFKLKKLHTLRISGNPLEGKLDHEHASSVSEYTSFLERIRALNIPKAFAQKTKSDTYIYKMNRKCILRLE